VRLSWREHRRPGPRAGNHLGPSLHRLKLYALRAVTNDGVIPLAATANLRKLFVGYCIFGAKRIEVVLCVLLGFWVGREREAKGMAGEGKKKYRAEG